MYRANGMHILCPRYSDTRKTFKWV